MDENKTKILRRYRERNKRPFDLINKIKLWPSRTGVLHGVRTVKREGNCVVVTTHCGCTLKTNDSKNGRVLRQLKRRTFKKACKKCDVPRWKMEKFDEK